MIRKKLFKSVLKYANQLRELQIDITEDYPDWVRIGLGFANSFEEEGRELFQLVSSINKEEYDEEETNQLYSDFLQTNSKRDPDQPRVTAASFLKMAKDAIEKHQSPDQPEVVTQ